MLSGSIVALVTPMQADGSVDFACLAELVEWHIAEGTSGIVAVGTTGESATLEFAEHLAVVEAVVKQARGRIPVLGGNGSASTAHAVKLTRALAELKVDACLCATPYYNKPTQEGLFLHYSAVAAASAVPQLLYNVPGRTACDMLPDTVVRLSQVPGIVGIKEATGLLARGIELREHCGKDFLLFSGDDATAMEFMLQGGDGVISVTANVAPRAMAQMCQAALAKDRARATELNASLDGLHRDLFIEANPIPAKWALQRLGRIGGGIRLPLTPLSPAAQPRVEAAMVQAGLL
ncbi:MAG: 4-hydroxy-tetrahydrodipicolinate synthase [Gammaproteobacteria bacterium]|nr:4-hydroxy-tetrahydrodipicolinate synthase [Gammaproteobacteria bacterium]